MFNGHGDDIYKYKGQIKVNFSSNIYQHANLSGLKEHLSNKLGLISNYPEPRPETLERAIATQSGISPDEVVTTNGATEAIYLAARALTTNSKGQGFNHIIHQPTFSEYADACLSCGITPQTEHDLNISHSVHWLCNPNNPTGTVISAEDLLKRADEHPDDIFIIDQSYENYTQRPMISDHEAVLRHNILLIHSFTKRFCIPGLRIGYAVGNTILTTRLRHLQYPWNINVLTIEAALWLINNDFKPIKNLNNYLAEAQQLSHAIATIDGITVFPSETNFMLCHIEQSTAAILKDFLVKTYGILIRDASNFIGLDSHYFRIAAQLPNENDMLIKGIKEFSMLIKSSHNT